MGTRAILVIDDSTTGPNTFYAQYASPAYKVPSLTRWIVAAARQGLPLSAEGYAAFAATDDADHFKERRDENLTLGTACQEWANSDLEYLYYVAPLEISPVTVGHFALYRKPIGAIKVTDWKLEEAATWLPDSQSEMHDASARYLTEMRGCVKPGMYRAEEVQASIATLLEWHADRKKEDAERS
ncbi:hypothetical protein [Paenarthrobacter sp. TA1.8]|uniref:hypothetical protein n=1 Tax=Paenarthrobacter sp. TA1.8 TaxID=3400219 RepID=UPI003B42A476